MLDAEVGKLFGAGLWPIAIMMILFSLIIDRIVSCSSVAGMVYGLSPSDVTSLNVSERVRKEPLRGRFSPYS